MKLRIPFLLGLVFGFTLTFSPASAQSGAQPALSWGNLGAEQREMVDLVAADFFETRLTDSQRRNILMQVSETYRTLSPAEQDALRRDRRKLWQSLSAEERRKVVSLKTPDFDALTEAQKAPFRDHALKQLKISPQSVASKTNRPTV